MRILLVKTSSLGDVVHNLPVVSDLARAYPDARIDWCVEEAFADIPRLHPAVGEIVPVAIRRWRKALGQRSTWQEMAALRQKLQRTPHDFILDTQGLVKSALLTRLARGRRCGYAAEVAREPLAARFYDDTFVIPRNVHAVQRNRWLAAAAFDLPLDTPLDYGILPPAYTADWLPPGDYAVLLSATSRSDKLWEETHWVALAAALLARGLIPIFPSGSVPERQRAERIVARVPGALAAPPLGLHELAGLLGRSALAVGVDTGLIHLAAALAVPSVALYVASDPALTGVFGKGFVRNLGGLGQMPALPQVWAVVEQALR